MGTGPPVVWLGGPPGAGKTTVARLLARRHGVRWYNADAHTWEHRARAVTRGHADAIRWEELSRAERWTGPPAELLAMSLHHDRGRMIADDLRALASAPLTIAEGTPVTPLVAGSGTDALWLLPSREVQEQRLLGRGLSPRDGTYRLYRSLLTEIETQVDEHGGRKLRVDGASDVAKTVAEVERAFTGALARGPVASTDGERRALLRYGNRALVSQHVQFFARPWAPPDSGALVRAFSCECGRTGCTEDVELLINGFPTPPDALSPPVLAPGHEAPAWPVSSPGSGSSPPPVRRR